MHKDTAEQEKIKKAPLSLNDIVTIQAYAGSGKTYILRKIAGRLRQTQPTWRVLYLAFNKDIVKEAKQVFSRNVHVMTTHGLATAAIGHRYFKANKISTSIRKVTIRSACKEWVRQVLEDELVYADPTYKLWCRDNADLEWGVSNTVWATINKYLYSGDEYIFKEHICAVTLSTVTCIITSDTIIAMAAHLWGRMKDLEDTFKATHDVYLKLYQLSHPKLHEQYQVIMFDEAQDANGATLSILDDADCCKIYVGDTHQQIYSWRGSTDAFRHIGEQATQEYRLTQSFRFNRSIARYATGILYAWKNEDLPVKGADIAGGVAILNSEQQKGVLNIKHTCLCRLNSSVFRKAVSYLDNCKFGFAGEKSRYKDLFNDILDTYYLYMQDKSKIQNPFIGKYTDLGAMQAYAVQSEDYEIMQLCTIVKSYHENIPTLLQKIWEQALPEAASHITLTTGHKAKGLEWPYVVICEDFADKFRDGGSRCEEGSTGNTVNVSRYSYSCTEEANLLYVAITRAQHTVYIPAVVSDMITDHVKTAQIERADRIPEANYTE